MYAVFSVDGESVGRSPKLAVSPAVAEWRCTAAEQGGGFDD